MNMNKLQTNSNQPYWWEKMADLCTVHLRCWQRWIFKNLTKSSPEPKTISPPVFPCPSVNSPRAKDRAVTAKSCGLNSFTWRPMATHLGLSDDVRLLLSSNRDLLKQGAMVNSQPWNCESFCCAEFKWRSCPGIITLHTPMRGCSTPAAWTWPKGAANHHRLYRWYWGICK